MDKLQNLHVAEWLMMSRMSGVSTAQQRCITCANCTVCHKNRKIYYDYDILDPPPRLVRVIPEDTLRTRTQIFTPVTPGNPYLTDNVTSYYDQRIERTYKRRNSDDIEVTTNKRFRPSFTELPLVTKSTSPMSPPSPPSPIQHRGRDTFSSSDEEEKPKLDEKKHKKEVGK